MKEKINVLYICIGNSMGGATQSLLDTLTSLQAHINPVVVIKEQYEMYDILTAKRIKTYIIPFEEGYGPIGSNTTVEAEKNFMAEYETAIAIGEIIDSEEIELVHTSGSTTNVGAIAALLKGVPHIFHVREFMEEDFALEYWDKRLKKRLFDNSSEVIAISESVGDSLKLKYGITSMVIYNPIDKERYGLNHIYRDLTENVFLIAGSVTIEKGQLDALKAVEELKRQGVTNFKLIIIGTADDRNRWIVRNYVKDKKLSDIVECHFFQNNVLEWRERANFSITPSRMEAFGRSTAEGMLSGLLTIGADTGGTKELIGVSMERGLLYKQGDYLSLATAMRTVMQMDKREADEIRYRAYEFVANELSLASYAEKVLSVYEKCLNYSESNKSKEITRELSRRYIDAKEAFPKDEMYSRSLNRTDFFIKDLLYKWIAILHNGKHVVDFFISEGYSKIAIYGMGAIGCSLFDEISNSSEISVEFVFDKNPYGISEIVKLAEVGDMPVYVDCIVVCVAGKESILIDSLREKYNLPVIGMSEIINFFPF